MTEEEKKVMTRLQQIQCSCEGIFYNFEAGAVLNLIEKQQKEIENSVPKEEIREKIEDIEDYFDRLNVPDEDIKFIREKRKEILGE